MQKTYFIVFFCVFASLAFAQGALRGDLGASPTTMGTIGESFNLHYMPLWLVDLGVKGEHKKEFEEKLAYQREGASLQGNVARDTYSGRASLGPRFSFGAFEISPYAALDLSKADSYSMSRVLVPGLGLPSDTSSFIDFDETQSDFSAMGGLDLGLALGSFSLAASALYGPASSSALKGTMLQTYPSNIGVVPTYLWSTTAYDHATKGYFVEGSLSIGLSLPRVGIDLRAFASLAKGRYGATGSNTVTLWTPYRSAAGATTQIIETAPSNMPVRIDSDRTTLEAGASVGLVFLKNALSLRGVPALDLSYVRYANETTTINTDTMNVQKWVEDFGYFKFALKFGI